MILHRVKNKPTDQQKGITLLLALLVMAAIGSIIFSVAAITLNEIKTSSDITKSEPSVTGAEAVAEEILYKSIRGIGAETVSNDCSAQSATTLGNQVSVRSCLSYYQSNPYTLIIDPNGEHDFYIYNPADQSVQPGYTSVKVSMDTGSG